MRSANHPGRRSFEGIRGLDPIASPPGLPGALPARAGCGAPCLDPPFQKRYILRRYAFVTARESEGFRIFHACREGDILLKGTQEQLIALEKQIEELRGYL